jgi:hypothetical protein
MYVTDWGVAHITVDGLRLEPNSGVVWRVDVLEGDAAAPLGVSRIYSLLLTLGLMVATAVLVSGRARPRSLALGFGLGLAAGAVMGAATMLVSTLVLNLPWYAPPRVFATMVMGPEAIANILEFVGLPFMVGLVVIGVLTGVLGAVFSCIARAPTAWRLIVGGGAFGLAVWGLLQYFVLAELFPLVTEKGFPPFWYAVAFGIFGLTLGSLAVVAPRRPTTR